MQLKMLYAVRTENDFSFFRILHNITLPLFTNWNYSREMRINIARQQTLSRCYCYIDRNTICSETSLKCSFSRIILSAKKKEICRKFTRLIAFYASSRNHFLDPFIRSADRSIANSDALLARLQRNAKTSKTIYQTGSWLLSNFLRHLHFFPPLK